MGAVVDAGQTERVMAYIETGKAEGAKLRLGGKRMAGEGCLIEATLFDDVTSCMTIAQEEIFGPMLAPIAAKDIDEAVAIGNDTIYGLAAAVWTSDIDKAFKASSTLRAGVVGVNCFDHGDISSPFGGFKQSGFGRDKSLHALEKVHGVERPPGFTWATENDSERKMADLMFRGLIPAFPTPLKRDGSVDETGLERIVAYQIDKGASGLVPLGGTGEATALTAAQRKRVIEITVSVAAKRVPVLAGVLDPGLGGALDTGLMYRAAGADGLMVIPPYYTRADQEGVLRYFRALAPELKLPIIFYDNPYRAHIVTAPATIARMEEERLIVGMKASNTDLYHLDQLSRLVSDQFCLLSGQDTLFVQQVILGAKGGILTSASLLPDYWSKVQALAQSGQVSAALAAQARLNPLMDALFAEQFPEAVRRAFALLGLPIGQSLPPVGGLSAEADARLKSAVEALLATGDLEPIR